MSDNVLERQSPITPEHVGAFGRRRVLTLVLGMLGFVVLANGAARVALERHPVNRSNWLVREKWRLLDRSAPAETLVLGDSSCSQGVNPAVLDRALATRSRNFCTIGNMLLVGDVWMLTEYLRLHGAPKRVIIVHVYDAWSRTQELVFAQLLGKIERPWGFWNRMDPPVDLDASELEEVAISRWFPLYGESTSLARLAKMPLEGAPPSFELDDAGFMRVTTPMPARVLQDAALHRRQLGAISNPVAALSEINRKALIRLGEIATQYKLDVVIAPAPIYDGLWNDPSIQKHVGLLQEQIQSTLASSRVRVLVRAPLTFSADQMENVDHIVGDDAVRRYTQWLATAVLGTGSDTHEH